jgi:hypothetical protein
VQVSRSVALLENGEFDELQISDANVRLYKNDTLIHSLTEKPNSPGVYIMETGIHDYDLGGTYELRVKADGYPPVNAFTVAPLSNDPIKIDFEEYGFSFDSDDYSSINITINDPIDIDNFYELSVLEVRNSGLQNTYRRYYFDYIDPIFEEGLNNVIISDASFNGEEKTFELLIERAIIDFNPEILDSMYVNYRVISKDQYLFQKTAEKNITSKDNPFSTPVQIYTNIENGLGIFTIANDQFLKVI